MRTNKKKVVKKFDSTRLAGGMGTYGASQSNEKQLRRLVLAHLLFENSAYEKGGETVDEICRLVPLVNSTSVFKIAVEARVDQKLRHVPLLLAVEMCKYDSHKWLVKNLLPQIILRPDEITEFLALYWRDGRCPISAQAKKGLAAAFHNFDEYQLAKWNKRGKEVSLSDVLRLVHPTPRDKAQEEMWGRLRNGNLSTPDTWEVALSRGGDKKREWTRLIKENRLGAFAYLKNLRNMQDAGVDHNVIKHGFRQLNPEWLLPLNYLQAVKYAPSFVDEIEQLMLAGYQNREKLHGHTILVVDVSGSMAASVSVKSEVTRMEAAAAMTVMAREIFESISVYVTAGSDSYRKHKTEVVPAYRGFGLAAAILDTYKHMGGGGIFTRQCLEYIKEREPNADRIIVFSDSQDCDYPDMRIPKPFGKRNYIIDISSHKFGINYKGVWTAEITGWSESFLSYIMEVEKI